MAEGLMKTGFLPLRKGNCQLSPACQCELQEAESGMDLWPAGGELR